MGSCQGLTARGENGAGTPLPRIANVTSWLQEGCSAGLSGQQLYEMQSLFTIYVHRSPGVPGTRAGSIFYGRDIADRCAVAGAARHTMRA
jgi:hypothetical protein